MQTGSTEATAAAVTPHEQRLHRLTAIRRQRALLDHDETLLLAAIAADPEPWPGETLANDKDWVREEVSALLLLSPITAGFRMHIAEQLVERFPATVELMSHGELPGFYATRLVDLTGNLSPENAAKVEARVLPRAPMQTLSQFCAAIRRAVLAVDPATAQEKHARARADRRVVFNPPCEEGMVELWAVPPPRPSLLSSRPSIGGCPAVALTPSATSPPRTSAEPTRCVRWVPTPRRSARG